MSQPLTIVHAGRETGIPRKLPQVQGDGQVFANYQPHTASLDALSAASQTAFGLSLLGEASATHLLGTTLSAYTKAQTDSAISTALTPYITTAAANAAFQPLDADLTAIALLTTTSFGRGGLTWADAAAGRTALSVYSSTQTDTAITTALSPYITTTAANAAIAAALVPYLTSTTAASTYQPIGSYVTYAAQTITTGQQAQARTNIGAQVAGSYPTGSGTCSGTNTGDETATTIKSKLGITTLSGSNTGDQTLSLTVPSIFTSGGSSTSALSFTVASQTANMVWAAPNGAAGAPSFRLLVAADIPSLPAYQPAGTYATGTGTASGTNTGDETATTIKSKLGITTLSGSNTGDQDLSSYATTAALTSAQALDEKLANKGVASGYAGLDGSGLLSTSTVPALTGDVTKPAGSAVTILATAQPAVHTWALAQTFTVAPVFTDASGTRTALGVAYGTSGTTVAVGNDSRITGALQTANNLSELSSASNAAAVRLNIAISKANTALTDANGSVFVNSGQMIIAPAITANRTYSLSQTAAIAGDLVEYRRTGADAFNATMKDLTSGATLTSTMVVNRTYRFRYNGTAWVYWGSSAD